MRPLAFTSEIAAIRAARRRAAPGPDRRTAPLVTQQAMLVGVLTGAFALYFILTGAGVLGVVLTPLVALAALSLVLNTRGHYAAAKHLLLASSNAYIYVFSEHLGTGAALQTLFFATVGNAVLLFDARAWGHVAVAVAQPVLYLVLIYTSDFVQLPLAPSPVELPAGFPLLVSLLATLTLCLTFFNFARRNRRFERAAETANARLAREVRLVHAQQELVIVANSATTLAAALPEAQRRIAGLTGWRPIAPPPARRAGDGPVERCVLAAGRVAWAPVAGGLEIGVPVICGGEVVAVMRFVAGGTAAAPPEPELERALEHIGRQLGHVEERARAQAAIDHSNMQMAAAAKMATLGEMAGGIAHEINNPLSVIQGYLARIRKLAGWPEGRASTEDAIDAINATIYRITKIVSGLRAFARDSAGDPFEDAPVARLVLDALALTGERFRKRGIQLVVDHVDPAMVIPCRPTQITQVLVNLLANAFDAVEDTPAPQVRIAVEAGEDSIVLSVLDCGPGIPEEMREKVLMPFFTTKPVGRGTGLGLSISKGIVDDHGGALEFARVGGGAEGEGMTRFSVRLPRTRGEG